MYRGTGDRFHMRTSMILASVVSSLLLILQAGYAGGILFTDFEDPTYSLGTIHGQDSWAIISSPGGGTEIQAQVVASGAQAVKVTRGSGPEGNGAVRYIGRDIGRRTVEVSTDIRIASATTNSFWTAIHTAFELGGNIDVNTGVRL